MHCVFTSEFRIHFSACGVIIKLVILLSKMEVEVVACVLYYSGIKEEELK